MTVKRGGQPLHHGPARSLGEEFRITRTSAGASIEQAESDLRIKAKYIVAMEEGDVSSLPNRVYSEGFVRNYATYLGLDPVDAVRRFKGATGPVERPSAKTREPKRKASRPANIDPLAGIPVSGGRRNPLVAFGRGVLAFWPLVLVGGVGYGLYTGYGIARDAGLIPPELGGIARPAPTGEAATELAESETPTSSAPTATREAEAATSDTRGTSRVGTTGVQVASLAPELVGNEAPASIVRPDSLGYARAGVTPYWQAAPPAVEPVDGPVSEIEPETAGIIPRADDQSASRWTDSSHESEVPTDVDASRIAAEAREALIATLMPATMAEAVPAPTVEVAELTPALSGVGTLATDSETLDPAVLGPIITAPAYEPVAIPRRFALHATQDTWIQVKDSLGNVAYTGILSPGEIYTIPDTTGLRLKTGNAGGLYIEVDGQRYGPLGSNGAVMRNVPLNPGSIRASYELSHGALPLQ